LTGTPIEIRCSLLTLDLVQSSGFSIGGVLSCTYASRLLSQRQHNGSHGSEPKHDLRRLVDHDLS
jgi:hypothetical protein